MQPKLKLGMLNHVRLTPSLIDMVIRRVQPCIIEKVGCALNRLYGIVCVIPRLHFRVSAP